MAKNMVERHPDELLKYDGKEILLQDVMVPFPTPPNCYDLNSLEFDNKARVIRIIEGNFTLHEIPNEVPLSREPKYCVLHYPTTGIGGKIGNFTYYREPVLPTIIRWGTQVINIDCADDDLFEKFLESAKRDNPEFDEVRYTGVVLSETQFDSIIENTLKEGGVMTIVDNALVRQDRNPIRLADILKEKYPLRKSKTYPSYLFFLNASE